jgi:hypothetical protein
MQMAHLISIYRMPALEKTKNPTGYLPPQGSGFNLILRMYLPAEQVLNGTWTPPAVQRVG